VVWCDVPIAYLGLLCQTDCLLTACRCLGYPPPLHQLVTGGFFKSKAMAFIPDIEAGHRTGEAMEEAGV
jgi:hypothetical protein